MSSVNVTLMTSVLESEFDQLMDKYMPTTPIGYMKAAMACLGFYILFTIWYLSPKLSSYFKAINIFNTKLNKRLPFFPWIPPAGDMNFLITGHEHFFAKRQKPSHKYGGFVHWLMNELVLIIDDPVLHKKALTMDDLKFGRNWSMFRVAKMVFGKSIIASEGEDWRRQHRVLYRAFNSENLVAFRAAYSHRAARLIKTFSDFAKTGETVNIQEHIYNSTMGVVIDCGFGDSLTAKDREEVVYLFRYMTKESPNFIHNLPIFSTLAGFDLKRKLRRYQELGDIAVQRRKSCLGVDNHDGLEIVANKVMIDMLLEAAREDPEFTDEMVRDNALLLLSAGSETTGTTMQWVIYLVSTHPEVYARVMEENKGLNLDDMENPGDLCKLVPYLTNVIKETLRYRVPITGTPPRITREPMQLGDLHIPAGVGLSSNSVAYHFNAKFWDRPDMFNPDRFNKKDSTQNPAFIPFGTGRRYCLGKYMAMAELQVQLSHLFRSLRFEFAGKPDDVVVKYRPPLYQPNGNMDMKIFVLENDN
eukprot:m.136245 g.136245  ORF g.136245 m.136245 type:complete len:530 (+) comp10537_c0_seq1:74-1663(+)